MLQGWNIVPLALLLSVNTACAKDLPAPKEKTDEQIRVKLGDFAAFFLNGYDLKLNDRARLADHKKLEVTCTGEDAAGKVKLGTLGTYPSPVKIEASGGFIFINGDAYRAKIFVHARGNECLVVNELGVEKYIAGVLNAEMQASWPIEALKAQAVTARSYALHAVHNNLDATYHVDNDTRDQMYRGAASETVKSNLATTATRGTVLYHESEVLKAYYHANCGGRTDLPESVWGEKKNGPYRSVACPYHRHQEAKQRWAVKIEKDQLENVLRRASGALPGGFVQLASLTNGTITPGMRHKSVVLTDVTGRRVEIDANAFRQYVGFNRLKSTKFEIRAEANALEFRGVGFGHGVGMCQLGAKEMALQGKNHLAILQHYYPLARLANLY